MPQVKHLVLDAGVVLAAWQDESSPGVAAQLVAEARRRGVSLWVATSSLAAIEAQAGPQRMASLFETLQVLSSFGFEQGELSRRARRFADAQIVAAARALGGVEVRIVTLTQDFDTLGEMTCLSPQAALAWLAEAAGADTPAMRFVDLPRQQAALRPALEAAMEGVLRHGQYILGDEVATLECQLAAYVGAAHCIAVANGTDALQIAMMALGVGAAPGDEVITPGFNFVATAEAAALLGARPVYVDVDPRTYNLDPHWLAAAITPRTKAIVPTSLYGQCADLEAVNAIAARHGIPVIEDAAQSLGATHHGRRSGALSTVACTSFFPSKPLGCYGDGGAIFTNDDGLAKAMRQIARHGQDGRYHHVRVGTNSRLDTLQAALLLPKLAVLDQEIALRQEAAARYERLLRPAGIAAPFVEPHNRSAWAQYTVRVPGRDAVRARLAAAGIPTVVHYPTPLNRQPALPDPSAHLPASDAAAAEVLSLPFGPYILEAEQARVAAALLAGNALTAGVGKG